MEQARGKSKAQVRYEVEKKDPERYKRIKEEQEKLFAECPTSIKVVRSCPYCEHKLGEIFRGQHGYTIIKCENCGETTIFPPLCFRIA